MQNRYQKHLDCLGSKAFLTIITDKDSLFVDEVFTTLISKVEDFEERFSRFLGDSELTSFNQSAGKKTTISPELKDILVETNKMSILTNNIFSPFILPSLQKSGYTSSWTNKDLISPDFSNRQDNSDFEIKIGENWAEIPKNSAIDLGGIGKGYLLDQLSNYLDKTDISNYWLSLGGDIICNGQDMNNKPWQISIADALDDRLILDYTENRHGVKMAIATSGVTKRKGIHNNKAWNHIIDPRTNEPIKNNILTVTVTANNAVTADVMAKCIVIEGPDKAKKLVKNKRISGFLMQYLGKSSKIEICKENIN